MRQRYRPQFDLDTWRRMLDASDQAWSAVVTSVRRDSAYAFIAAFTVWPAIDAIRSGDKAALALLRRLLPSTGEQLASLLADCSDELEAAKRLDEVLRSQRWLYDVLDLLIEELGSMELVLRQAAGGERRHEFFILASELRARRRGRTPADPGRRSARRGRARTFDEEAPSAAREAPPVFREAFTDGAAEESPASESGEEIAETEAAVSEAGAGEAAASEGADTGVIPPAPPDPVLLGASAPSAVQPGDEFTARCVAYVEAHEPKIREILTSLSPRSPQHLGLKKCRWQRGTPVTVICEGRHLNVDEPAREFVWDGEFALVEFDVTVAESAPDGTTVLKFNVAVDGVRLARLRVDLQVSSAKQSSDPQFIEARPAETAFASYASEDRPRVLDRVSAVKISAGLDVFLDCVSLRVGEEWKPALLREIDGRDLFLLFWSKNARTSDWVEWEWRTALESKGREAFQFHPLDTPDDAPPPQELKGLHFGDPLVVLRRDAQERRKKAGGDADSKGSGDR